MLLDSKAPSMCLSDVQVRAGTLHEKALWAVVHQGQTAFLGVCPYFEN